MKRRTLIIYLCIICLLWSTFLFFKLGSRLKEISPIIQEQSLKKPCIPIRAPQENEVFKVAFPNNISRLFNPSIAIPWGVNGLQVGGRAIGIYRGRDDKKRNSVLLRIRPLPFISNGTGDPVLPAFNRDPIVFGWIDEPKNEKQCLKMGFEDPKGFLWRDKLFIITNAGDPETCHRRMAVLEVDASDLVKKLEPPAHNVSIKALKITYLIPPDNLTKVEKNWMPFLYQGIPYFVRYVNPHEIVQCFSPIERNCVVVANTSWPQLNSLFGIKEDVPLHGSTPVIEIEKEYITVAHYFLLEKRNETTKPHRK